MDEGSVSFRGRRLTKEGGTGGASWASREVRVSGTFYYSYPAYIKEIFEADNRFKILESEWIFSDLKAWTEFKAEYLRDVERTGYSLREYKGNKVRREVSLQVNS